MAEMTEIKDPDILECFRRFLDTKEEKLYTVPEITTSDGATAYLQLIDENYCLKNAVPNFLLGQFSMLDEMPIFKVETPAEIEDRRFFCEQTDTAFKQVLYYLARMEAEAMLNGYYHDECFYITSIRPAGTPFHPERFGEHFFQALFERCSSQSSTPTAPTHSYDMHSMKEFQMYVELFENELPHWVISAYTRNREIIEHEDNSSKEERRHARKTIEILLNTEWTGNKLALPPICEIIKELDSRFVGIEHVKRRISEIAAQMRRSRNLPKWGILLHGPAGVGKTSIAKAIAQILSMPLIELDVPTLGKDPEALCGSSRVFSNGKPGMLAESFNRFHSSQAVLLVNELDKTAEEHSIVDSLLTILDKTGFYEHYLEEFLPTENLFCIATCNDLHRISKPLLDRFLIIDILGYSADEKKEIWNRHVLPAAMDRACIPSSELYLSEKAAERVLTRYVSGPGIRDMEAIAERIVGHYCVEAEINEMNGQVCYTETDIDTILGNQPEVIRRFVIHPGLVNTAYVEDGIVQLRQVEATVHAGAGSFRITGPISDEQAAFAQAAYDCACKTYPEISKMDVSVFVLDPIMEHQKNVVGLACFTAICSSLQKITFNAADSMFIGGCTPSGMLYSDETDTASILKYTADEKITFIYGPVGIQNQTKSFATHIVPQIIAEAYEAKIIFDIASYYAKIAKMSQNNLSGREDQR